jgi:glucan phosphoethanolaminetransferase (alkaline phosphatase superfamily)
MRETGFLTQQVTLWLNRSGAIVLAILLINLLLTRRRVAPRWWFLANITLAIMVIIHIALFQLHPHLDAFLDASTQTIRERPAFHREHLLYMNLSTVQWTAALIHLWSILTLWRKSDIEAAHKIDPQPA